tara:strand:+ start:797 stop:1069 length:273 start_codon:yes stop_codon:yes gene_type:complete
MIFPRLTSNQNVLGWATQLVAALGKNRDEIFSSFTRQDTGGTIRLDGRIQVNQNITSPDVAQDDREGEIRYNAATSKFQGFDGTLWQDFH